jgi:RNA polymerase sigma factor (TIGR02999 family)
MSDVTQLLAQIESGDQQASQELLPLVYGELRKLAAAWMASERPDHTLQATALVHEAYVRLVDVQEAQNWNGRGHFFSAAAEAMRRILVDHARRRAGPEAGGGLQRLEITSVEPEGLNADLDLLDLNDALDRLAAKDARKAELVKLRFFAGLTNEQAANVLGVTNRTAYADWGYAKAWLRVEMS